MTSIKPDSRISEMNLKKNKYQNICTQAYYIQTPENKKNKEKSWKKASGIEGGNTLSKEMQR